MHGRTHNKSRLSNSRLLRAWGHSRAPDRLRYPARTNSWQFLKNSSREAPVFGCASLGAAFLLRWFLRSVLSGASSTIIRRSIMANLTMSQNFLNSHFRTTRSNHKRLRLRSRQSGIQTSQPRILPMWSMIRFRSRRRSPEAVRPWLDHTKSIAAF